LKAQDLLKRALGSRLLKWGVVLAAIGVGAYEIHKEWVEVHQALGTIGFVTCLWALLALLGMQLATLCVWRTLLVGLGSPLPMPAAGRILFIGQLGKYIPGSVWPILAQMELGARAKVPRARSASASVLAMLLSLVTGLIIAMVTLPFAQRDMQYLWVFLLLPVILVCLHPRVLNPLLGKLFKLAKRPELDQPLTGPVLARALGWAIVAWLFNGLQIFLMAEKFGAPVGKTILLSLGGYAFAWCVGFVIIIAPAGAGVREVLLVAFLSPVIGRPAALAVAVCSRAVNTISDLLVAGAAAANRRKAGTQKAGDGQTAGKAQPEIPAETVTPVPSVPEVGA
jgi:glycosyltransferase 2 family protein